MSGLFVMKSDVQKSLATLDKASAAPRLGSQPSFVASTLWRQQLEALSKKPILRRFLTFVSTLLIEIFCSWISCTCKQHFYKSTMAKPFRILDLPPEIRTKIYILICTSPTSHVSLSTVSSPFSEPIHPSYPHNLLLTNTQLYHELRPVYFTCNTFSLTIRRRNDDWSYFLAPQFLDNRRQIHALKIVVLRWGTKDFFCKNLIPALEDCVLNGRLRDVEVVVKEGFLKALGKGEWFENWKRLSNLLRDPYLERVRLLAGTFEEDYGEGILERTKDVTELLKLEGNAVLAI